jgi:negative regulator of flagellin synthesis FlgM
MKIDNSVKGLTSPVGGNEARQRADKATTAGQSAESGASAQVKISALSSLGVDSVLANAPVTNPEKIAEIKQAIADGRFTVNADKIADGLLDSVRQLLGKSGADA